MAIVLYVQYCDNGRLLLWHFGSPHLGLSFFFSHSNLGKYFPFLWYGSSYIFNISIRPLGLLVLLNFLWFHGTVLLASIIWVIWKSIIFNTLAFVCCSCKHLPPSLFRRYLKWACKHQMNARIVESNLLVDFGSVHCYLWRFETYLWFTWCWKAY